MDDRAFIAAFEACALPPERFRHRDHLRLAWLFLREATFPGALERFAAGLRRFARAIGKEGLYHETITVAYLALVNERMARFGPDLGWEELARRNADLFDHPGALRPFYREETLGSELARSVFVLPDRGCGGARRD